MTYLPNMQVTGDDMSVSFDITPMVHDLTKQVLKRVEEGAVGEVIAFLAENGHLADMIRKEKEEAWDEGYSMGAIDIWLSQTPNPKPLQGGSMNHQAIEAAVEALKSTEDFTEEVASTLLDSWAETISSIVLEAAMPYIREQIADEIKAEGLLEAAAECWEGYEVTDNRGVYFWLERRAKELKGKS